MNKVILSGNLCRDIELKKTTSGKSVLTNCIAVSRDRKESDGSYASDFINIVVWDKNAEFLDSFAQKGDKVELCGRWNVRTYENKGGVQTVNECIVESIKLLSKSEKTEEKVEQKTEQASIEQESSDKLKNLFEEGYDDDDLPF